MADGVRVDGLTQVIAALVALGAETEDFKDAFADIAQEGARLASGYAPRLSGALAADVRGNRAKSKAVITAGRASVPYAGVINYGYRARNIAASGFMQRADSALAPYSVRRLEDHIDRIIRKQGLQ